MHPLFHQVLILKNLSKAGDLFLLEDYLVINDFNEVLTTIQEIITKPNFLTNHNDQSLVEISITRLTSAIRETKTIENHASGLVALLETCLSYNLKQGNNGLDPPHAKIASDVMSCIFLNYSKRNVMELSVPVSVKFLHKGNKDLSRNMSSYLSLAAIENAPLLAQHIQPIIDSVISGNYSLAKILPTIYAVNRDPINNHVMTLVSILPNCENTEKLALLSLFAHVAKDNPALLEPSVPQLCEDLSSQSIAASTFQVLYNIALQKPQILADHIYQYKLTAKNFPKTAMSAIQVMCAIAKVKQEKSAEVMEFILSTVGCMESEKHSMVLKEILGLINLYPHLLTANLVNKISNLKDEASSVTRNYIQEIQNEYNSRCSISKENLLSSELSSVNSGVTIVKVNGGGGGGGYYHQPQKTQHLYQQQVSKGVDSKGSSGSRNRLDRMAGRFQSTHRSMTRLNAGGGSHLISESPHPTSGVSSSSQGNFDSRLGLNKSMTRLNSSHQSMSRSASNQVVPQVARSVTCISNGSRPLSGGQPFSQESVARAHSGGNNLNGSSTKSMSFGSMAGMTSSTADGREVLTVNVDQINADLLRQASTVLSKHHDINELPPVAPLPTSSYTHIASIPITTHSTNLYQNNTNPSIPTAAPFSLPSYSTRRAPPYNSGPLPTSTMTSSQPQSLGMPLSPTANNNLAPISQNSPQLRHHRKSQRPHSLFSNTLPSPRRRSNTEKGYSNQSNDATEIDGGKYERLSGSVDGGVKEIGEKKSESESRLNSKQNRMSVFEPYPMRDTVQHFCEKHLDKVKAYMTSLSVKLPLPVKCTIEERKGRKHAKLHFACQGRAEDYCLYKSTFYTLKTRNPRTWIHLMFLSLQARSSSALSTRETSVSALKHCWEILKCENISFVTLVTGAFPPPKDQDTLMHELRSHRFFDVFEYNGPKQHWGCFLCNHPERASNFMQDNEPVIEGQLKEKKGGKWNLFKKWKSRYFTLAGAKLTYKESQNGSMSQTLDIGSIRSVKVTKEGRRNIPKAFEIFTSEKTFVLKAKDSSNAQKWVQCLSIARAHSQAQDTNNLRKVTYAGSLGRLNHHNHHGRHMHMRSSLANSNIALRTAV